jgi:hypothetical protein
VRYIVLESIAILNGPPGIAARGYAYVAHHLPHDADSREIGTGHTRADMLRGLSAAAAVGA